MIKVDYDKLDSCSQIGYAYDVHDQLVRHIYSRSQEAFAAGDEARELINSAATLQQHQTRLRESLLDGFGGLPASDQDLAAVVTGRTATEHYSVENVVFQSRPQHYVTANFYLPNDLAGPSAAVLLLCGHDPRGKQDYLKIAHIFARSGFAVLVQDPIGQGERLSYYKTDLSSPPVFGCAQEHDYAGTQCLPLGDGLARYFLHDSIRAIDYLCSRPDVDPSRIAVTGASGGGTQTCLMAMAESRIAAAAPCCFLTSRPAYQATGQAQDAEQIWFNFSNAGFDHADILLAMAPRPVLVMAATSDFFPMEGTRASVEKARRALECACIESTIELFEEPTVHSYSENMALAAAAFFARHLLDREIEPVIDTPTLSDGSLLCTQSGQVTSEFPQAEFVFAANGQRLQRIKGERRESPGLSQNATSWLRERVFHNRGGCELNPRYFQSALFEELRLDFAHWWSQPRLLNHGCLIRRAADASAEYEVTIAVWDGGTTALTSHLDWIRCSLTDAGKAVLVLDVSGCGAICTRQLNPYQADDFYGTNHRLATDLMWLGDNLAALRTYDVLRAVDMLEQWQDIKVRNLKLYGSGLHGLYARLAAPLNERFNAIIFTGGLASYEDLILSRYYSTRDIHSVLLHGALKYFDLPDLETSIKP